jgi:hypothetical protein
MPAISEDDRQPGWITSPVGAAGAICLAVWMFSEHVRAVLRNASPQWHGMHQFDGILPHYAQVAENVLLYALMAGMLITTFKELRSAERAWWVLLCSAGLLQPLRLLPVGASRIVLYAQMGVELAMIAAAVQLFIALRKRAGTRPPQVPS